VLTNHLQSPGGEQCTSVVCKTFVSFTETQNCGFSEIFLVQLKKLKLCT